MTRVSEAKDELQFNAELTDLLEVMKNIAVFEFRALQRKKERFAKFSQSMEDFFKMVDLGQAPHFFITPKSRRLAAVMITSDEGFMGGLNMEVINEAVFLEGADEAELLIVGQRGTRYLREMEKEFVEFKGAADAGERYSLALRLKDYIVKGAREGRFGRVFISYPRPISFMVQKVEAVKVLPITRDEGQRAKDEFVHRPSERSERPSIVHRNVKRETSSDVIIESPLEGIVEYLVEEKILQQLIEILEDSKLSEFAARAIHLERSSQQLAEAKKGLNLRYFRARHEIIDKNTRELFSAQIIRRKA